MTAVDYDAEGRRPFYLIGCGRHQTDSQTLRFTPEGHGVRYDSKGEVIGVTIINARRIIERDGYLTITLPHSVRVDAGQLAAALA